MFVPSSDTAFLRKVLIVAAVGAGALLAWRLRDVALLLFASVLVALSLRALSRPLIVLLKLNEKLAVLAAFLGLVLMLALLGVFFGLRIQAQIDEVSDLLPQALQSFMAQVRQNPLGARALADLRQSHVETVFPTLMRLPRFALSGALIAGDVLLVVFGGIYLAAQADLYRDGLLRLAPTARRPLAVALIDEIGRLLRKWLLAQLISMALVGVMVGLGLWIIGAPAPVALGLLAGAAEFVPFVGPVVSALPALLLALLHGADKAGWTLALFILVHLVEANLLQPLIQRQMVLIPPVLTIFALVSFALVFGPLGVFLAAPLTVVCLTAATLPFGGQGPEPASEAADRQSRRARPA